MRDLRFRGGQDQGKVDLARRSQVRGLLGQVSTYSLGRQVVRRCFKMFSESSTGCWAVLTAAVLPKQKARGTF